MKLLAKNIKQFLLISLGLLLSILFMACERMIGFNYEGEKPIKKAKVYGTIRNIFNSEPVPNAQIQIGNNITFSDALGEYLIFFTLGVDEERDKTVPVIIIAENFFPFYDSFLLYPRETDYNPTLTYAAPIIKESVLTFHIPDGWICQARIKDYQGVEDITSVVGTFLYSRMGAIHYTVLNQNLDYIRNISETEAYYQCTTPPSLGDGWFLDTKTKYKIKVIDKDGYSDNVEESDGGDLLFPYIPIIS